jgi:hypothetical protein
MDTNPVVFMTRLNERFLFLPNKIFYFMIYQYYTKQMYLGSHKLTYCLKICYVYLRIIFLFSLLIFGPKSDEVTGEWRKLHNEELLNLYSSPDITRQVKSRRMRWAGHVARMGEERKVYKVW